MNCLFLCSFALFHFQNQGLDILPDVRTGHLRRENRDRRSTWIFVLHDPKRLVHTKMILVKSKFHTRYYLSEFYLDTNSVNKRTCTAMFRYTVPPVTHERFAMITDPACYFDARNVICTVLDETSARRSVHAFRHSTTAANDGLLNITAKIAECAVFLWLSALIAFHELVAGMNCKSSIRRPEDNRY